MPVPVVEQIDYGFGQSYLSHFPLSLYVRPVGWKCDQGT
jgi:hypothetical protein